MKHSTKVGWLLITLALILGAFLLAGRSSLADQPRDKGLVLGDHGKRLIRYEGNAEHVTVPTGVVTVEKKAFKGTSVQRVDFASTVTDMGSGVFSGCKDLEQVTLGNVEAIPADTFSDCESLSDVTIPGTVKEIGSNAFSGCKSLGSVSLPEAITNIDYETAFQDCKKLNAVSISNNSFYSTEDGSLFNASGTRLLKVPEGKKAISLKKGVTAIGTGAFSGNQKIKQVVLPGTVDTVEDEAFGHSGVETLNVPESVTQFGRQSKWKPETIYGYGGSEAESFASQANVKFVDLKAESQLDETYDTGEDDEDVDARMYPDDPEDSDDPDDPGDTEDPDNPDEPDDPEDPDDEDEPGPDDPAEAHMEDPAGYDDDDDEDEEYVEVNATDDNGASTKKQNQTSRKPASRTTTTRRRSGGTTVRTSQRSKDATPKTADIHIDPRYILCLVLLVGGAYVVISSQWRGIRLVKKGWEKNQKQWEDEEE